MLRIELRTAIFRALETGTTVEVARIPLSLEGVEYGVSLRVSPSRETNPDYLLVILTPGS